MAVLDRFSLDGRRALVTGASRGLGAAMARALAEAGADVVLHASEKAPTDAARDLARALGHIDIPAARHKRNTLERSTISTSSYVLAVDGGWLAR